MIEGWPVGTRLLAPHRLACRDHIYEVLSGPDEMGWQVTKCLVCDEVTQPLDVSRWEESDVGAMMRCLDSITADIKRLEQARDILTGERRWANYD